MDPQKYKFDPRILSEYSRIAKAPRTGRSDPTLDFAGARIRLQGSETNFRVFSKLSSVARWAVLPRQFCLVTQSYKCIVFSLILAHHRNNR